MNDFPAAIDLAGLDGSNGFRLDGIDADDNSGYSVSSAGDVNGDGFDDVIIGAAFADQAGESYVVFGKAGGYGVSLDLASLDGSNGFRLDGIDASDQSGFSVSSAGDVNGDGYDDVIIGAYQADQGGDLDAGESYVVFGKLGGYSASLDLASLDGSNGFRLDGIDASDQSGFSVSSAGDVNGDGFDDVIIGANGADPVGDGQAGESYVVFGKAGGYGVSLDLASLDGIDGFRLDGIDANDLSGNSVSSAGDVNGDGFDDVIIGALAADPGGDGQAGESYVVFGKASGYAASLDLASLDGSNGFRLDGIDANDRSGFSVSSAGDVNGDGFDDVIIGANLAHPDGGIAAGESYVVFGKAGGYGISLDLASLDGSNGFRLDGIDAFDFSGNSVSSAGDVNGDGFDDVIIGARFADQGADNNVGESYVVFGKAGGYGISLDLASLDGSNGFRLDGVDANDESGFSVSSAGDVNGDGFDDVIIGAPDADPGGDGEAGESYVVFGKGPQAATARFGSDNDQTIRGGNFDDYLNGMGGNDTLIGGDGNDVLTDGLDIDTLVLNPGAETDQYAQVANFAMPGAQGTIEMVLAPGELPVGGDYFPTFMSYNVSGSNQDRIVVRGNPVQEDRPFVEIFIDGDTVVTDYRASGLFDGVPHRMSITFDSDANVVELFIDGELVHSATSDLAPLPAGGTLMFGQEQDSLGGGFNPFEIYRGETADIRIWDDVRTAQEIKDNAFVEITDPVSEQGLVANWRPDGVTETVPDVANPGGSTDLMLKVVIDSGSPLPGFDNFGGGGDDVLNGGEGNDLLIGGTGDDMLDGGAGFDAVSYEGATGGVSVYLQFTGLDVGGGQGVDTLVSIESLTGSNFDDRLIGSTEANVLNGGAGNDILKGKGGNDTFRGGDGDDRITGSSGNDTMFGDDGSDILFALSGLDELNGGQGNDFLYGGRDADVLNGNLNDDVLRGNLGNDTLNGGGGVDDLRGGGSNDVLNGDNGDDFLFGDNGKDIVFGGGGSDSLSGGSGGGVGDGFMDTFVYSDTASGGGGFDRIKDWEDGTDVIDLTSFGFTDFTTDVMSLASNASTNMRINFGNGDVLLVENFDVADFDAGDVLL